MTGAGMVAGLGCRQGATAAEIVACIEAALAAHGLATASLAALAIPPSKSAQPSLHRAAGELGLPLLVASEAGLAGAAPRLLSRSAASLAASGSPSASEAAALAIAGPCARLLGPRHALGPVTCAIAIREQES